MRQVCGPCFTEMTEMVPVASEGKIVSFTILRFQFLDPETGKRSPCPTVMAFSSSMGPIITFSIFSKSLRMNPGYGSARG